MPQPTVDLPSSFSRVTVVSFGHTVQLREAGPAARRLYNIAKPDMQEFLETARSGR